MVNLLSKRMPGKMGELASELPTASEDAVESDEQQDDQQSAAGEAMPSVAMPIAVVSVRAEVRAAEAIRVPEWPEDKTEEQRDCDEDEDGWNDDESEHCVFSIRAYVGRGTSPTGYKAPVGLGGQG
jgi:hypothetical protein